MLKGIGGAAAIVLGARSLGLASAQDATPAASPAAVDYPDLVVTAVDDAFGLVGQTNAG
jgi:hypothetical protein